MDISMVLQMLLGTIIGLLLLAGCGAGGDGSISREPNLQFEHQAILNLVQAYASALQREDIDRLQELLAPGNTTLPERGGRGDEASFTASQAFRRTITAAFRTGAITDVRVPESVDELHITTDPLRVSFQEEEHVEDPVALAQQSRLYRTTFQLTREESEGAVIFRIAGVRREGPRIRVSTRGQVVAGIPARVEVTGTASSFILASGHIELSGTGDRWELQATNSRLHAVFIPSTDAKVQRLQLRLHSTSGEVVEMSHRYRVRVSGEGVVQRIHGTANRRVRAVTLAADGTVWAAGDLDLYRIAPGETSVASEDRLPLEDPRSRVEDLALDRNDRLHMVMFVPLRSGVILRSQLTFCQTVNAFDRTGHPDPVYPFLVWDPESEVMEPSPSTRAIAAGGGDIWLFGSDGGVARVAEDVGQAPCPALGEAVAVHYDPIFRRQDGQEGNRLLTNTVPALVVSDDGALWFGTALGLMRWHDGRFTSVPFERSLTLSQDKIATLESYIREVARAIREARPVEAVEIGDVSFLDFFGRALVKEDCTFSAVEDDQGRLWVGTLGGGIRRIEADTSGESFQDTLHLTRSEVARINPGNRERTPVMSRGLLVSNIIFALATGSDGVVWAATDEGVSRIEEKDDGTFAITNFTVLDGLRLPVRDIAVDEDGVAWVATEGGLFRVISQGFQVSGAVRQTAMTMELPAIGVDVSIRDTPFRTVTNAEGQFVLINLPPEHHDLQVEGVLAQGGLLTEAFRPVDMTSMSQTLAPIVLAHRQPAVPIDPSQGGRITFPTVPGAELIVQPEGVAFLNGSPPEIGLTLLPLTGPPYPLPASTPRAVAAAELRPGGLSFTKPFTITLPNQGQRPSGRRVFLQCLKKNALGYSLEGSGLVNSNGTTLTVESFETPAGSCAAIVFAARASAASKVQMHPLAGEDDLNTFTLAMHHTQGKSRGDGDGPRRGVVAMVSDRLPVRHTTQQTPGSPQGLTLLNIPPEAIVDTVHSLAFQLTDATGQPAAAAGVPVSWVVEIPRSDPDTPRQAASLCLATTETADCLDHGVTDAAGQVSVRLTVGHTAGRIRVFPFAEIEEGSEYQPIDVQALPDRSKARLVMVSGNNQEGQPGQELEEPLVVQLEDQFDNPIADVEVLATVVSGEAEFIDSRTSNTAVTMLDSQGTPPQERPMRIEATNAQGEVRFRLRVLEDAEARDIQIRVTVPAPAFAQVAPVQFLVIVGSVATPDIPFDIAVFGQTVYVARFTSGLQIIDVSSPTNPTLLTPIDLEGSETQLALADERLYVGTNLPNRLYVLDLTAPETPATLGSIELPQAVQPHRIVSIAIQSGVAYILTRDLIASTGSLQVIDVHNPARPQVLGAFSGFIDDPVNIAIAGNIAYVPAETAVYIFDINNPSAPTVVGMLGDPDPSDNVQSAFFSDMLVSGNFAYLVETKCMPDCRGTTTSRRELFFTVLDLRNPLSPQRRGVVQVQREGGMDASFSSEGERQFAYLAEFELGLRAIDITKPDAPQFVGRIDTPSTVEGVAVAESLIYVIDNIFGLLVIRGPGATPMDTDGDGVVDFFDIFPNNSAEAFDTDRDGIGDNADPDDDNDGFTDEEERQATPPTNPADPRFFPVRLPLVETTTLVVDAATTAPVKEQDGTPNTPYL